MTERAGAAGPGFRAAHLAIASAGALGAWGVLALDASEWIRWLTTGGEVTPSRHERVAIARALLALSASGVAALGLAGAVLPDATRAGYRSVERVAREALDGRNREQRRAAAVSVSVSTLALAGLVGLAWSIHRLTGTPLADLTRDPTSVVRAAPWVGLLSNVGVVLWTSAAAICFLGAVLLRDRGAPPRRVGLLWASGAFTTLLMLDDLFLLHEDILPGLTGLPEIVFVCAYPLLFLALLARYATTILEVDWSLVLITGTLLGASMGIDTVWDSSRRAFAEDALKLAGILTWLLFLARALRTWVSKPPRSITQPGSKTSWSDTSS